MFRRTMARIRMQPSLQDSFLPSLSKSNNDNHSSNERFLQTNAQTDENVDNRNLLVIFLMLLVVLILVCRVTSYTRLMRGQRNSNNNGNNNRGIEATWGTQAHHNSSELLVEERKKAVANALRIQKYKVATKSTSAPKNASSSSSTTSSNESKTQKQPPQDETALATKTSATATTSSATAETPAETTASAKTSEQNIGDKTTTAEPADVAEADHVCSICLDSFKVDETVAVSRTERCSHTFHRDCITEWLLKSAECPCCRTVLIDEDAIRSSRRSNGGGSGSSRRLADGMEVFDRLHREGSQREFSILRYGADTDADVLSYLEENNGNNDDDDDDDNDDSRRDNYDDATDRV